MQTDHIRNFCIIAHIDHGKSTLADRLLEETKTVTAREMKAQFLDKMDIERERGITIKAQAVRMLHKVGEETYELNLIDTPGHIDFNYEVSRSLKACEGALLVVDASQGVEAQTVINFFLAIDNGLEVIPVINKIDLPSADIERVKKEIEDILGLEAKDAVLTSAKTGQGVEALLKAIIHKIPPPKGDFKKPLQALIFDSWFDNYQGAMALVRVVNGSLTKGMNITMLSSGKTYQVTGLGIIAPEPVAVSELSPGDVGFVAAGIKEVRECKIGDTITGTEDPTQNPLPGFKEVKPMVFAGLYPQDSAQYESLKMALEKLRLNDGSFTFEPETSSALGFGFRCGFLGLLHMDIVRERLEREYNLQLITTAPTVIYKVLTQDGTTHQVDNPSKLPPEGQIVEFQEPYIRSHIHTPKDYLGAIMALCQERRGVQTDLSYLTPDHAMLTYELPFGEIVFDFYDRLKSLSQGYASFDYEVLDWKPAELVRLNILVNTDPVDALSIIIHKDKAYQRGREVVTKLRHVIPRQQFEVALQASIGSRIIARETLKPLRKNVTAKCYGGDITRKRKLLEKQKEGKRRMKRVGSVEIPQEAFLTVLKVEE